MGAQIPVPATRLTAKQAGWVLDCPPHEHARPKALQTSKSAVSHPALRDKPAGR
jgi:hypothetical protein